MHEQGSVRLMYIIFFPLVAVFFTAFASYLLMIKMPGISYSGPLPKLTPAQNALRHELEGYVRTLSEEIGPRSTRHYAELNAAADYIQGQFEQLGAAGSQRFTQDGVEVRNVELEIPGSDKSSEIVVIGAHYDTVINCPGANDNGSGVAAMLALARRAARSVPKRTLRFVAFVNEEPPYFQTEAMGSYKYALRSSERKEHIVAMLSLETLGYYSDEPKSQVYPQPLNIFYPSRGNFVGFVGNTSNLKLVRKSITAFRAAADFPSQGASMPEALPGIGWSDHWSFSMAGFPAIMVTDTAPFRYPYYHHTEDTWDKLDYERFARVVEGLEAVIAKLTDE